MGAVLKGDGTRVFLVTCFAQFARVRAAAILRKQFLGVRRPKILKFARAFRRS